MTDGGGNPTGWRYTNEADEVETYDAEGKLVLLTSREGLTQTLKYSCKVVSETCPVVTSPFIAPIAGLLITVTDPVGRQLNFTYDQEARVDTITDPAGRTYIYGYTELVSSANLTVVRYPDINGQINFRRYLYGEAAHVSPNPDPGVSYDNALTGKIDENGNRYATWSYDAKGRVATSEHGVGVEKVTLTYQLDGTTSVSDAIGGSRSYQFQTILGAIKNTGLTRQDSASRILTYDANGNVASRSDWNGNRTNYTYEVARNLETSRTEGLTSAGGTTPQTRTISTQWHAMFRLPTGIAEPLRITTFVHDADGTQCGARGALCSRSIQATTDASGSQGFSATPSGAPRTWTYTYNSNGFVLTVNGPRTDISDVTTYTYYTNNDPDLGKRGNVATITNAAGHVTSITAYNAHGQPLTIVDPNGLSTTMTYDARQRLKTRTVSGETTTYDYDGVGQLTKVTLPDGSFLSYTYDGAHRLTGMQDNLGNRIAYTLDAMGNRTQEQVFDPVNQLAQTRSRVFNNLNRLFQELGAQSQTTEYAYDNQGNVASVKDPLNRITSNQYDALNRLKQVTDPALGVTQYGYNGLDALSQVTDPRSLVTGYTVDGLGNLNVQSSPDTGTTTNTYDAAGNLLAQTDAKAQTTTYAYEALNRVTLITFHDGSKQSYAYDQGPNAIGRLSSITETNPANQVTSVIAYAYDQHGRVTSEIRTVNGIQYVLAYRYDSFGRLDQLTYPSGRTVNYAFDALGRVSGLTTTKTGEQPQTVVSSVSYHPFGGVKGYTLGNGQAYTRGIDLDGRISSYTLGSQSFAVGYDAASRISFINDIGNPSNVNTYGYDNLDRLTSAVLPSTPYAYSYDAVGNRLSQTVGTATATYAYGATSNRLSSITLAPGASRVFSFDANGSTTNDGINQYIYDARGRLVQSAGLLGSATYQLNALGQRIRKTSAAGDRVFVYDTQGRLIAETSPPGATLTEYVYLGDLPLALVRAGTVSYIHVDHLNTPRLVANQAGQTVWRWDQQEPFGLIPPNENPSGLGVFEFNLRFPGQYFDKETGLNYSYYRDCYDPVIGRFCQADPIGFSGGSLSLYAYVDSNPLRFIDPLGLQAIPVPAPTPPIAGPNSGGASNIAKALNNLINKIIEACKPDDKKCPPCKLIDGTVVPVGTIAYRPLDTPPAGKIEHGISGPHYNLYKANQNPNNCQCFWQPIGAVPPPLQPDWIPIQPFAN